MHSSGTIGKAEAMREKRRRAVQLSKAGLEIPEDGPPLKKGSFKYILENDASSRIESDQSGPEEVSCRDNILLLRCSKRDDCDHEGSEKGHLKPGGNSSADAENLPVQEVQENDKAFCMVEIENNSESISHGTYTASDKSLEMRSRLSGGHFRMLNEKLYTCSGIEAFNYFKNDPQLFDLYHAGYTEQMSHWPEQPVNIIIKWLKSHNSSLTVADFGCGNASLARSVKNKVYSFDLVSNDPSVIACDMSHTPLDSSAVDVAVFCLSLMGTNFPNYLKEASRVLKLCGWLLIAEVRSRLDPNNGGADPDKFIEAVHLLGFNLVSKDFTNKMFVLFYFQKKEKTLEVQEIEWPELKPCLYKRR